MRSREKELSGLYGQIARKFADLHDTPERMMAKGVLTDVVQWEDARRYFVKRLGQRLADAAAGKALPR